MEREGWVITLHLKGGTSYDFKSEVKPMVIEIGGTGYIKFEKDGKKRHVAIKDYFEGFDISKV